VLVTHKNLYETVLPDFYYPNSFVGNRSARQCAEFYGS
jgi:hypothetical protein